MRHAFAIVGCLVMLAAPLSVSFPVHAQPTDGTPQAQEGTEDAWNGGCPERQELREERERIRAEHEDLDNEHDRIKMQCMDAKGQERSECNEEKQALHAKMDALHERMRILQEKAAADHGCHHEHKGNGAKDQWPARQEQPGGNAAPPQSETTR